MTRRELALLLPLLLLFLLATGVVPDRPDDEAGYVALAERLADGYYTTGNDAALLDPDPSYPDLWFGPGLPLLLTPLVALGAPVEALRFVGPVLLFLAVVVFFALVRLRFPTRTALAAAYLLGLYLPFLTLLPNLHSEPLGILLLVVGLYASARHLLDRRLGWLLLGAASFAGLALTRVAFGWVLAVSAVVLVGWAAVARRPLLLRLAAMQLGALVLCAPWLLFTWQTTERFPVWGTSGSLSLYWMASPYEGDAGDWRRADDVFSDAALAPHRPLFESLRGLDLGEQTRELEEAAVRNVLDHPGAYVGNVAANASRMLVNAPYSETSWSARGLVFAIPNLLLLGAVLLVAAQLARKRPALPPETAPFVVLGASNIALHLLVASYPRMLMLSVPVAVWLVVVGLAALRGIAYTSAEGHERRREGGRSSSPAIARTSASVWSPSTLTTRKTRPSPAPE